MRYRPFGRCCPNMRTATARRAPMHTTQRTSLPLPPLRGARIVRRACAAKSGSRLLAVDGAAAGPGATLSARQRLARSGVVTAGAPTSDWDEVNQRGAELVYAFAG